MRWDAAVAVWLEEVAEDSAIQGLLGTDPEFDLASERNFKVPSLEYSLISPAVPFEEVYWRTLIQLDCWMETLDNVVALERALVRLLHLEVPADIGTVPMWSQMVGGRTLESAKDGVFSRSLDFHLIYLRARYSS